jgi:hypothetical protein
MAADPSDDLGALFQATLDTIERRGSAYRWLVVAVVAAAAASGLAALVAWDWRPLLGVAAWAPLSGLFFALDGRIVRRWQARVLAAWQGGVLPLAALRQGLSMYPRLPARTLDGMLATLPRLEGESDALLDAAERSRHATEAARQLRRGARRALLGYSALTLALASAAGTALAGALWPLWGLVVAAALRMAASRRT